MKRIMIFLITALMLGLSAAASAAPAITDGTVTAWITEKNMLYLQNANGVTYTLNAPVVDLLSMDNEALYLLDQKGQLISVRKDGSMGKVLKSLPAQEDIDTHNEARFSLKDGVLVSGGEVLSVTATAAACDSSFVYWAEKKETIWRLGQAAANGLPGQGNNSLPLNGLSIPEPISLTVTPEGLALVATDRSVICFDLKDGSSKTYPATGYQTAAAAAVGGELIRYEELGNNAWAVESDSNRVIPITTQEPAVTPETTPVPTRMPTNTPAPTATPKPTPTATPDDRIHKGDRGTAVRRIQNRLDELGYPVGNIDGVYGQDTQTAISLFMDAIHVTERNYITPSVRRKLFDKNAPEYDPYLALKKGDSGLSVRYMQTRLQDLGYGPEKIDGRYGKLTVEAVEAFQEAAGFTVDGEKASRKMLKKLYSEDAPTLLVTVSGGVYKLGEKTAALVRPASRSIKTLTIPSSVEANGKSYSVTSVAKGACKGLTSLKKLTIGANVKKIGSEAFSGCSQLTKINVKTSKLTDDKLGSGVFKGVSKEATVTCPAELAKTYKKMFREHGLPKQVKFNP